MFAIFSDQEQTFSSRNVTYFSPLKPPVTSLFPSIVQAALVKNYQFLDLNLF